ncbi:MAG: 4a-hydroxytetrahydrobiopterin dehydratase [Candidatus Nanopelagicales bacterium]|nr:4a-hydroxytetrahydrobiopterin dehydratase [Candidatus Nanopelagicales bacterium]
MSDSSTWRTADNALHLSVTCSTFMAAIELVQQVALVAEEMDHHPDMDIRWRTVTFVLSTHSSGTLTELDYTLARKIDALVVDSN